MRQKNKTNEQTKKLLFSCPHSLSNLENNAQYYILCTFRSILATDLSGQRLLLLRNNWRNLKQQIPQTCPKPTIRRQDSTS